MDLLGLLTQSDGQQGLSGLASGLGLDSSKTNDLIDALSPALLQGLKNQATSVGGLGGLQKALTSGKHQQYLESENIMSAASSVSDGNKILGHLFGSKDVSRNVASQAAKSTGIDVGLIKKALPLIAGLVMAAMSKTANESGSIEASLPGLLGSLSGGDGFGLDDVVDIARKFF